MSLLNLSRKIDKFNDIIGQSSAFLTVFMVLTTFIITILRYVFKIGYISMQEAVIYMHAISFLLPTAIALRKNYHVRVDIFYSGLNPQKKALVDMLCHIFILLPVVIFCFYISWEYVSFSWQYFEGSREAGGLGGVFLIKTLLLVMPVLLFFQGISEIIKNYMIYKGYLPSDTFPKK